MKLVLDFFKIRYFTFRKIISRDLSQKRINLGLEKNGLILGFRKNENLVELNQLFCSFQPQFRFSTPAVPTCRKFIFSFYYAKSSAFQSNFEIFKDDCPDDPDLRFI